MSIEVPNKSGGTEKRGECEGSQVGAQCHHYYYTHTNKHQTQKQEISVLWFADDIVLFVESEVEVEEVKWFGEIIRQDIVWKVIKAEALKTCEIKIVLFEN